jgi:octaprenyl-diphosphate synthase
MTLPLIYALQQADWLTKRQIIYYVKNNSGKNEVVAKVIDFVKKSGGMNYAIDQMNAYAAEALQILHSFSPSPSRTSLEQLIMYTIEREK